MSITPEELVAVSVSIRDTLNHTWEPEADKVFAAAKRIAALEAQLAEANSLAHSRAMTIERLEKDLAAAQSYATTLAVSMHKQHYADAAPNWQPLTDLVGLLSQIDNMYAGLRNDLEAAEVENKRLVGLPLATLMVERDELRSCLSRAIEMSEEAWSDLTYRERAMLKPTIDQWRKAVVGK